jgi:hypothetical protein
MLYALLLLLKWALGIGISLPFFDKMYFTAGNIAIGLLIFGLPLVVSLALLQKRFPFKEWWLGFWELRHNRGLWLLVGGVVLGFLVVTGYFWIKMPQEFFSILCCCSKTAHTSSFHLYNVAEDNPKRHRFLKVSFIPIILSVPVAIVILNKKEFSRSDAFLSATMVIALVLCQWFYHLPRYYISLTLFLPLGLSCLMPPMSAQTLTDNLQSLAPKVKASLLVLLATLSIFLSMTIVLLTNYTGYDINWAWFTSNEEYVYKETIKYLEEAGAKKVYAINPIFVAMSSELESTLAFDSFAFVWLEGKPSEE